jgi:hypothetical protein
MMLRRPRVLAQMQSTVTTPHPDGVTPVKTSFRQEFYSRSALSHRCNKTESHTGHGGRLVGAAVAIADDVAVAFVVFTEPCPSTPATATLDQMVM